MLAHAPGSALLLSAHGQSQRTRDILASATSLHRDIPVRHDHEPALAVNGAAGTPPPESVYDKAAAGRAWVKRREDLDQLGDVGEQ